MLFSVDGARSPCGAATKLLNNSIETGMPTISKRAPALIPADSEPTSSPSSPPPPLLPPPAPPAPPAEDMSIRHNFSVTSIVADADADADAEAGCSQQPMKKRRKLEPKPRRTMTLDLTQSAHHVSHYQSEELNFLLRALSKKRKIVVVAGAGISVAAGIPDFRSSHGLFTTLKRDHKLRGASGKQLFDASVYSTSDLTTSFHEMVRKLSSMASNAAPTLFHHLMARLAKEGRLLRLYTQNVDGIETSLPPLRTEVPLNTRAPWPRTIQLHGGLEKMVCQKCRHTSPFEPDLFSGPTPPSCDRCKTIENDRSSAGQRSRGIGRLRPRIVLYNESNPDEEAIGSVVTADLRAKPDALIVVGTSMKIPGVRRIVKEMGNVVRKGRKDGVTIWINRDGETSGKDFEWDLVVKGECDEVARRAGFKHWDDDTEEESESKITTPSLGSEKFEVCTADDVDRVKREQGRVEVTILSTRASKIDRDTTPSIHTTCLKEVSPESDTVRWRPLPAYLGVGKVQANTPTNNMRKRNATSKKNISSTARTRAGSKSKTRGKRDDKLQQSILLPGQQVKPGVIGINVTSSGRRINTSSKNARKIRDASISSSIETSSQPTSEVPILNSSRDFSVQCDNHPFTPNATPDSGPQSPIKLRPYPRGSASTTSLRTTSAIIVPRSAREVMQEQGRPITTSRNTQYHVPASVSPQVKFGAAQSAASTIISGSTNKIKDRLRKKPLGVKTGSPHVSSQVLSHGITYEDGKLAPLPASSARYNGPTPPRSIGRPLNNSYTTDIYYKHDYYHLHSHNQEDYHEAPDGMQLRREVEENAYRHRTDSDVVWPSSATRVHVVANDSWSSSGEEMDAKRQLETISPKETGAILPNGMTQIID
ncbi:hypothetical protein KEM54_001454 [Ascosphaera aggregata]|nr:hypothetical protein KEM54_001454 [Ascosphaera aggregata]